MSAEELEEYGIRGDFGDDYKLREPTKDQMFISSKIKKHTGNDSFYSRDVYPFKPFDSIGSSSSSKSVNFVDIRTAGDLFDATEKIHGANYSFLVDVNGIFPCKRTGVILNKNGFFRTHSIVFEKYKNNILALAGELGHHVQEYGELYGGLWDGKNGEIVIQREVEYSIDPQFRVFSIRVNNDDIEYSKVVELCKKHGIDYCKILHTGTLSELLKLDPNFNTTISAMHNDGEIKEQIGEGYVFTSQKTYYDSSQKRRKCYSIKHKSLKFREHGKVVKLPQSKKYTPEEVKFLEMAVSYINLPRLNSVRSKIGVVPDDYRSKAKLIGMLIKDAKTDIIENEDSEFIVNSKFVKTIKKAATHEMTEAARALL
jgi:Rnl2 family RNA ligase